MNLNLNDTQLIISECMKRGLLRNQAAYVLATAYHETAHKMQPVREMGGEKYLKSKKYYPYVGMGYVQLTWDYNYKKATQKLGVDFMKNPTKLLDPTYAKQILVIGMVEGWFTGKKLSDYITLQKSDFKNARRIINGTDRADLIAGYAKQYDKDLKDIGYGEDQTVTANVTEIIPEPEPVKQIGKSKRFWAWLSSGGVATVIPFTDWRVQIFVVSIIVVVSIVSIVAMPEVRSKLQKWIASA